MVTFHDLRDVHPGVYARQADKWRNITQRVEERGNDVQRHLDGLADWTGPASENAELELGVLRSSLHDMTAELGKIPPVLTTLHDTLADLQRQLRSAIDDAIGRGFQFHTIGEDGTVSAPLAPLPGERGGGDGKKLADQLTNTFKDLLRRATEADATAADALRKLTAHATGFAPSSDFDEAVWDSITIPARGAPPEDVLKWWNGLSIEQREALLFNRADVIGAMDGIPAVVRDRANRSLLPGLTEQVREQIAVLESRHPVDQAQLAALRDKLGGLEGMAARLNHPVDATHQQAYLLKIGTDGTGRAIVAIGNPDTAHNVSTYVPGTGTRVGHAPADLDRADNMALAAIRADSSKSTAVITWMDYEAPQSIPDAAGTGYAEKAGNDLRNFEHGLRVTHDNAATGGPSHNTMIGHSYGGEVVGLTARDGAVDADALVFVATPTVGVSHPDGLHLTGVESGQMNDRVYHTVGDDDPMRHLSNSNRDSPHFPGRAGSPDPYPSDPLPGDPNPPPHRQGEAPFGGRAFASDSGTGHSDYWKIDNDRMNMALRNMGLIMTGKQPIS